MKINLFKKVKKKNPVVLRKETEIDPFFYWKRILIMISLILVAVAAVSFMIYYLVQNKSFITSESREKVKSLVVVELEEKKLDSIFNKFEDRKSKREEIAGNKEVFSDPAKPAPVKTETSTPASSGR